MLRKFVALADASDRIQKIGASEDAIECGRNCQEALDFIDQQHAAGNLDKVQDEALRKGVYAAVDQWQN